jgi:Ni,Fe-hydrogenase maturation factor
VSITKARFGARKDDGVGVWLAGKAQPVGHFRTDEIVSLVALGEGGDAYKS